MHEDIRKYARTRQIMDYDNIVDKLGQGRIVCIDEGVLSIVQYLLGSRGLWRSSYAVDRFNDVYTIPSIEEFKPIDNAISEFLEEADNMATCSELAELIASLSASLSGGLGGCCDNGSGGQSPDEPFSTFEDDGDNFPDGFEDRDDYNQYKCNAAQWFINRWQQDIGWLQTGGLAGGLAAGILGAYLLVPGINVIALAGLLILTVSLGVFAGELDAIQTWLDEENDILRCLLYSSVSASEASEALLSYLAGSSLTDQQQYIASYWVTNAAINEVFTAANVPELGAECLCGCDDYTVDIGIDLGGDSAQSVFSGADNRHWVQWTYACEITLETLNVSQTITTPSNNAYRLYDGSLSVIYSSNTPPTLPFAGVKTINLVKIPQAGAFTADWTVSE